VGKSFLECNQKNVAKVFAESSREQLIRVTVYMSRPIK
jgi:hypothetical protein